MGCQEVSLTDMASNWIYRHAHTAGLRRAVSPAWRQGVGVWRNPEPCSGLQLLTPRRLLLLLLPLIVLLLMILHIPLLLAASVLFARATTLLSCCCCLAASPLIGVLLPRCGIMACRWPCMAGGVLLGLDAKQLRLRGALGRLQQRA